MAKSKTPIVLRSVRALVDALGGTKAASAALGVLPSTVSNWLAFECIPPKRFLAVEAILKPLGYEPHPGIFREHRPQPSEKREAASA